MSFSAHYLFAVLLTIVSLPISLQAQSAPKETLKIARGSISGRVTIKEKGVFGVAVALRKSDPGNAVERIPRAMTDQDGFYRITDVAPGTYDVSPSAPAFVPTEAREPRGKTVLIGENENVENINFTLARGGVITGRVTDADGHPVIAQQVFIYRAGDFEQRRGQPQQPQIYAAGSASTDDRGIYRVFGLMPGRYKVAAGRSENTFTGPITAGRVSYTQVFHPDATDETKATVIEVGEGTEAGNIDITLGRALQTFTVAGRVIDGEKNAPAPNIRLVFQRQVGRRVEVANTPAMSNAQGEFVKEGLVPGKYGVFVLSNEEGGMRAEPITFDVIDQDVNGVTVKLTQGASLSGVVVLETENTAALAKLSELQLRAYVTGVSGTVGVSGSSSSSIGPNGSFHLTGLPGGLANLQLDSKTGSGPPKGFSIARIERDNTVIVRGIPIQEREQLTGVRVVLNYGTATLRGVVEIENGTLPAGARIFIHIVKPAERENSINLRPPPVDARGHFLIEGIPAGTYEVWASVSGVASRSNLQAKREVTFQDGVTTDITLTIDMNPPSPKP